jgi:hypothetical protein
MTGFLHCICCTLVPLYSAEKSSHVDASPQTVGGAVEAGVDRDINLGCFNLTWRVSSDLHEPQPKAPRLIRD